MTSIKRAKLRFGRHMTRKLPGRPTAGTLRRFHRQQGVAILTASQLGRYEPLPITSMDDFPLGAACDMSGEFGCEACQ